MEFKNYLEERKVHVAALRSMLESGYFPTYNSFEQYVYMDKPEIFKEIGSGFFSVAFDHRDSSKAGEFIMKMAFRGDDDIGYKAFIPIARKNAASNSLFPRIEYVYTFSSGEYVAFIEKLNVNPSSIDRLFSELASRVWEKTKFFTRFREVQQKYGMFSYFSFEILGRVKWDPKFNPKQQASGYKYFIEAAKLLNVPHEQLYDFISKVIHSGRRWDLHRENVGYRKDGSWVFFDPIA